MSNTSSKQETNQEFEQNIKQDIENKIMKCTSHIEDLRTQFNVLCKRYADHISTAEDLVNCLFFINKIYNIDSIFITDRSELRHIVIHNYNNTEIIESIFENRLLTPIRPVTGFLINIDDLITKERFTKMFNNMIGCGLDEEHYTLNNLKKDLVDPY